MTDKQHQFPIMEIFGPVIQGEGALAGRLTHFIRFGGCGHRCKWCDTMWAVDPKQVKENRVMMTAEEIHIIIQQLNYSPWITFSGGDPCIQKRMGEVIELLGGDYLLAVETQGAIWQDWLYEVDLVTLSPKGPSSGMENKLGDFHKVLSKLALNKGYNMEPVEVVLKIVVDPENEDDFQFAMDRIEDFCESHPEHHPCYLQPCSPVDPTKDSEHKVLEILRRYRLLCSRVFQAVANGELPVSDVTVLPQLHAITWPDQNKGI